MFEEFHFIAFCFRTLLQGLVFNIAMHDILKLVDVVDAIKPIFIANGKPSGRHFELCDRFANRLQIALKALLAIYSLLVCAVEIPFMVESYMSGSMRPCVLAYFIGMKEYSTKWIILLHAYNYVMIYFVTMFFVTVDMLVVSAFLSVIFLSVRFETEVTAFNKDLESGRSTPEEMKQRMKDIILMHREYDE